MQDFVRSSRPIGNPALMKLSDPENLIDLPGHMGRHTTDYHKYVLQMLRNATRGQTGAKARAVLVRALKALRSELEGNPRLPISGILYRIRI